MATKFTKNLTLNNKSIKESRAQLIGEDAEAAQAELLRTLRQQHRDLQRKKDSLSDLYPDTELSLQPAKGGFDAKKWVVDLQNTNVAIANKQIEIDIAQETYEEWFSDESLPK